MLKVYKKGSFIRFYHIIYLETIIIHESMKIVS